MDSNEVSKVYFKDKACMYAGKMKKRFKKSGKSPKDIFFLSNVRLGCNLT